MPICSQSLISERYHSAKVKPCEFPRRKKVSLIAEKLTMEKSKKNIEMFLFICKQNASRTRQISRRKRVSL